MGFRCRYRSLLAWLVAGLAGLSALTAPSTSQATGQTRTITAVCEDPVGRVIGLTDHAGGPKYVDQGDFISGGRFRFVWETDAPVAHVIRSGSPETEPGSSYAEIVREDRDSVTFVASQGHSVWMHTLLLRSEILLVSQHEEGPQGAAGGALNRSAVAACTVTGATDPAPRDHPPMTPQTMRAPPPPSGSGSSR